MVIELEDAEPKESERLVAEARELLMGVTPWPWFDFKAGEWLAEPKHLLSNFADSMVIARSPELLSALCNELEAQVSLNNVQEQSIREFQREQKQMQSALQDAYRAIKSLPENALGMDTTYGHWYRDELMANIESALTPKGEMK